MTWTEKEIASMFSDFEAAGLRVPDAYRSPEGYQRAVRVWCAGLHGIPYRAVGVALGMHLRTPERGRFWPSVADLVAHIPQAHALAVAPSLDPDEGAWERITAALRLGPDAPELRSEVTYTEEESVEAIRRWDRAAGREVQVGTRTVHRVRVTQRPSPFERSLTETQRAALAQIGGLSALRQLEDGISRAGARKRFLALCRAPEQMQVDAPPLTAAPRLEIPADAPPMLRLALGGSDPRAAERVRSIERARREAE
jgi:hypothetical protein